MNMHCFATYNSSPQVSADLQNLSNSTVYLCQGFSSPTPTLVFTSEQFVCITSFLHVSTYYSHPHPYLLNYTKNTGQLYNWPYTNLYYIIYVLRWCKGNISRNLIIRWLAVSFGLRPLCLQGIASSHKHQVPVHIIISFPCHFVWQPNTSPPFPPLHSQSSTQ